MDDDKPKEELDRLIARLLDGVSGEGNSTEVIHRILRELKESELDDREVESRIKNLLAAFRIEDRSQSSAIAGLVDDLGEAIAELERGGHHLDDSERLGLDEVKKAREILQERLFPSERPVSAFHCPAALAANPDEVQYLLDQTGEQFEQTAPGRWESRESGFCCIVDPETFFANFRITSKTIRWEDHVPQTLSYLLSVRDCTDLRGVCELDFIDRRFEGDRQVQEQIAIARRQKEQTELAIQEQRFDDASKHSDEYRRTCQCLNRLCVERDRNDSC